MIQESTKYKSITLNARQLCDLELLLNGGFAPLTGFMTQNDYDSVVNHMRLASGQLWPIPITLSIPAAQYAAYMGESQLTLKDMTGNPLAILTIVDIYKPDLHKECQHVLGTVDTNHPYAEILLAETDIYYVGGSLQKIQLPLHYDFTDLRLAPAETRDYFAALHWTTVIGFQTRNPMHRSHYELTQFALREAGPDAKLLLHPVVGITQPCDIEYQTRVRCYRELLSHYDVSRIKLALLPLSMRMAGPREAVWHAIIRKNYGCTHFVVGRDHAGPSYKTKEGRDFYGPYDAQELLIKHADEIGIKVIVSPAIVYVKELDKYLPVNEVPHGLTIMNLSGTEQRNLLQKGYEIPAWFSFPNVIKELRNEVQPRPHQQGFCLYFIGLSGSGKSTLANAVQSWLQETHPARRITLLDADVVRLNLSKGLGFSRDDRSINVQRIGYVASLVVKHAGICVCANIAPYETDRRINRQIISQYGPYVEIYVKTSLDVCEQRDVKGLYAMARQGRLPQFTGISDPFEEPLNASLVLDGTCPIIENVARITDYLRAIRCI